MPERIMGSPGADLPDTAGAGSVLRAGGRAATM